MAPYEGQADRRLFRRRFAVAGRAPEQDVGDIGVFRPADADPGQHAVEQLAAPADEGTADTVLVRRSEHPSNASTAARSSARSLAASANACALTSTALCGVVAAATVRVAAAGIAGATGLGTGRIFDCRRSRGSPRIAPPAPTAPCHSRSRESAARSCIRRA